MQMSEFSSRRWSLRAALALLTVIVMIISTALPAVGGTVEEFTDTSTEIAISLDPGVGENSSAIAFPTDSRVRDARVTLRADHDLRFTRVLADGGNVSAWSASPDVLDLGAFDGGILKDEPFTAGDMTKVALNSTDSSKTSISSNVTTHMFAFDLATVIELAPRDISLLLAWTGMGKRQGMIPADSVSLYIADFARDQWVLWDHLERSPATDVQQHFATNLGPYSGWTDASGEMYLMVAVAPFSAGMGTSLTTSHVALEVWHTLSPTDLAIDVGDDGSAEWMWNGTGTGMYGLQTELEDGSDLATADFESQGEHRNLTSFLVPVGADLVEAKVALAGQPGEITTDKDEDTTFVDAHGLTALSVDGLPDYATPTWAQVILKDMKNAGQKDQSQEIVTGGQGFGNFGVAGRSMAQTFTPAISGKLVFVNVSLEGSVIPDAPNITVEIRSTNVTGHPTSTILGTTSINGSKVNQSSAKWFTAFFSDVELSIGTMYAIVLSAPAADLGETYEWKNHF
jgi:hypothetical protein